MEIQNDPILFIGLMTKETITRYREKQVIRDFQILIYYIEVFDTKL